MRARKRRRRIPFCKPRAEWLVAATGLLVALFLCWLAIQVMTLAADLRHANQARDLLASQVQRLGATPVAGPPGSRGEPGRSVTGPQGPKGEPGPSGSPGPTGPPGKNGTDGTDGVGTAGQPGIVGATGPSGPQGVQGETGATGPQGAAGKDGKDGRDGQTCPDGYSLQAPTWDADALVCRKDNAPPPDPGNGNGNNPQALGLDPQRRQYP
ncbi:collagen-like protein [Streptomyces sp. K1PN6]|uniref:Collagen-like protein n=1 Tax=Streptomyces acidicola TaxID=2596892 RepID=A0A5N8WM57_9ACTN|nr:collagen-like protein [Streptomyces acidicola]MPY47315.1 collagen-like protein [Streptomyces acidicola]